MKCYYHITDLDGHSSGAIVKQKFPECQMIGVSYDSVLDFSTIKKGETIYIVDFSFDRETTEKLIQIADVIWIDHHKSAIAKLKGLDIKGTREIGKAGCELTWDFINPLENIPSCIYLLGRYDVWDHQDNDVLPFQYGMRNLEHTLPDAEIWKDLLSGDSKEFSSILEKGRLLFEYEMGQNTKYAKAFSYEAKLNGSTVIAVNKGMANSKLLDTVYDPEKHDFMVIYSHRGDKFKYSLYSTKDEVDVSEIAVKFGGGGHKGAAGFYHTDFVLEKAI